MELIAEREGAVALELFREFDWCMWGVGTVTLPAFEAQLRVTRTVTTITDHVKYVLLGHASLAAVVVRTVDIQIVIDIHLHRVALLTKSDDTEKHTYTIIVNYCSNNAGHILHLYPLTHTQKKHTV